MDVVGFTKVVEFDLTRHRINEHVVHFQVRNDVTDPVEQVQAMHHLTQDTFELFARPTVCSRKPFQITRHVFHQLVHEVRYLGGTVHPPAGVKGTVHIKVFVHIFEWL